MVVRRVKKLKKQLGAGRTRGAGNTENRRGAGSTGGKGFTGNFKHKRHLFFDRVGAARKNKPLTFINSTTFNEINEYLYKQFKTQKEPFVLDFAKDKYFIKFNKIVCKGKLNYKINVKNVNVTERAKKVIEDKGGSVE
jgi:ribosomal protein L15